MPRRHIETRNIVFHKVDIPNGSLCMMKTEISTNGEAPIEAREKDTQIQAQLKEKRDLDLFNRKVISTQERDTNVATAESSRASVQADEAAVEQAELNLGHSKIKASIDGYVTKEAVATGDYVQVGQALMSLVPPRGWWNA